MDAGLETDTVIRQAPMTITGTRRPLDDTDIDELEKMLFIPLDSLVLKMLELEHYSDLLTVLPWDNRCQVSILMLMTVQASRKGLMDVRKIL